MFRLLKLKPPNGWSAVAWELGIVTLGVLIALAAQQWAEARSWDARARVATAALRDEVRNHYQYAVEWRSVEPCLYAQIDRLSARLTASGDRIDPAPVYSEPGFDFYVLRMPNRQYSDGAWQAAISDGVTTHFEPQVREELSDLHARLDSLNEATALNNVAYTRLYGLSRPLQIDAGSRLAFLAALDELRGRVEYMSLLSAQTIGNIMRAGLAPDRVEIMRRAEQAGTLRFCRKQGLKTRPLADAVKLLPD